MTETDMKEYCLTLYMKHLAMVRILIVTMLLLNIIFMAIVPSAQGWSNGTPGSAYANTADDYDISKNYGTHDWIANKALDLLRGKEKNRINLTEYFYGTELPDNTNSPDYAPSVNKEHIYISQDYIITDKSGAEIAQEYYEKSKNNFKNSQYDIASRQLGIMTHFIADLSSFPHVMGKDTDWGESSVHSKFEQNVNKNTLSSLYSPFNNFIIEEKRVQRSAHDAAIDLAWNITFGNYSSDTSMASCVWMESHYSWDNNLFVSNVGNSLNLATNFIADVIYQLLIDANIINERLSDILEDITKIAVEGFFEFVDEQSPAMQAILVFAFGCGIGLILLLIPILLYFRKIKKNRNKISEMIISIDTDLTANVNWYHIIIDSICFWI